MKTEADRPRAARDPVRRREEILSVAERILVDGGAASLTLRAVAAAANMSIGHFQHYFPDREALHLGLAERWMEQFRNKAAARLAHAGTPGEKLDALILQLLDDMNTPLGSLGVWEFWILGARDPAAASNLRVGYDTLYAAVAATIGGEPQRAKQAARLIVAMVEGVGVLSSHDRDPSSARERLVPSLLAAAHLIGGV